jgi:flagellar biosynthesis protein FlhA
VNTSQRIGRVGIPLAVALVVVMLVVPLPAFVIDQLIALNITLSLLVLLIAMNVRRPLEFSVFPSLLLVVTMFRLALNVSSTRLVLLNGYAGKVINAFGHVVVGGSIVVGLVVFAILVIIQFMVITNGAGRVAEVGARFTLDAMPGKQMAIDADLNAGLIDEVEARRRREEVSAEADFYGAMDGASKFVKGDAVSCIVITLVNLIGGFAIGMGQRHMSVGDAASTYSLLSVGDGLVSQIPALLMSVATGLIVTRSTGTGDMGSEIVRQFSAQKHALRLGGVAILGLCVVPGLPKTPFLISGTVLLLVAQRLPDPDSQPVVAETNEPPAPARDSVEGLAEEMRVDPIELLLAADILDLVDVSRGGDLLERVRALRRKVALELGVVLPPVRTRDSLDLPPSTYAIRVNGVEVARGQAPPGCILALGDNLQGLPGTPTREPVFQLEGKWVAIALRPHAELTGATVVDCASVITTHLAEVVRRHASVLLRREDVRALVDIVRREHPSVVEELTPAQLTLGEVQRVLQALLDEQVPIRDLVRILEAVSLRARTGTDVEGLVEAARQALGPAIGAAHVQDGQLSVVMFEPRVEHALLESLRHADSGSLLILDAARVEHLSRGVSGLLIRAAELGRSPVLVCSPQLRPAVRRMLAPSLPNLPVLSYGEVVTGADIETIGMVDLDHANAA